MADEAHWIALFSGGKDSSWALYRARERGLAVTHLLTAVPRGDSFLYHVPATEILDVVAEGIGLPRVAFPVEVPEMRDATARGDAELELLADAIADLDESVPGGVDGLITGAVESRYQRDRIARLCKRFGLDEFSPLWGCDAEETLDGMLEAGFDIRVVAVAADGLDRDWLGRRLDRAAIAELRTLRETHGIHLLGEGGEYETLVVDGPHVSRPLTVETTTHWDGMRGHLEIASATLSDAPGAVTDRS